MKESKSTKKKVKSGFLPFMKKKHISNSQLINKIIKKKGFFSREKSYKELLNNLATKKNFVESKTQKNNLTKQEQEIWDKICEEVKKNKGTNNFINNKRCKENVIINKESELLKEGIDSEMESFLKSHMVDKKKVESKLFDKEKAESKLKSLEELKERINTSEYISFKNATKKLDIYITKLKSAIEIINHLDDKIKPIIDFYNKVNNIDDILELPSSNDFFKSLQEDIKIKLGANFIEYYEYNITGECFNYVKTDTNFENKEGAILNDFYLNSMIDNLKTHSKKKKELTILVDSINKIKNDNELYSNSLTLMSELKQETELLNQLLTEAKENLEDVNSKNNEFTKSYKNMIDIIQNYIDKELIDISQELITALKKLKESESGINNFKSGLEQGEVVAINPEKIYCEGNEGILKTIKEELKSNESKFISLGNLPDIKSLFDKLIKPSICSDVKLKKNTVENELNLVKPINNTSIKQKKKKKFKTAHIENTNTSQENPDCATEQILKDYRNKNVCIRNKKSSLSDILKEIKTYNSSNPIISLIEKIDDESEKKKLLRLLHTLKYSLDKYYSNFDNLNEDELKDKRRVLEEKIIELQKLDLPLISEKERKIINKFLDYVRDTIIIKINHHISNYCTNLKKGDEKRLIYGCENNKIIKLKKFQDLLKLIVNIYFLLEEINIEIDNINAKKINALSIEETLLQIIYKIDELNFKLTGTQIEYKWTDAINKLKSPHLSDKKKLDTIIQLKIAKDLGISDIQTINKKLEYLRINYAHLKSSGEYDNHLFEIEFLLLVYFYLNNGVEKSKIIRKLEILIELEGCENLENLINEFYDLLLWLKNRVLELMKFNKIHPKYKKHIVIDEHREFRDDTKETIKEVLIILQTKKKFLNFDKFINIMSKDANIDNEKNLSLETIKYTSVKNILNNIIPKYTIIYNREGPLVVAGKKTIKKKKKKKKQKSSKKKK